MKSLRWVVGLVCVFAVSESLHAQVPWETPLLVAPHAPRGVSLLAASYAAAPGDGFGVIVNWRHTNAPGVGFRIAGGQGRGETNAAGAGIDVSGWISQANKDFPIDMIWFTGVGGSYGRFAQIALPMGISAGHSFGENNPVWFSPYAAARVIMEGRVGGAAPDDEFDLQIATELGANLSFDRNRKFVVRMAASMGDRSAVAIGAHLGGGKRVQRTAARAH